jgi:hypothetical protein
MKARQEHEAHVAKMEEGRQEMLRTEAKRREIDELRVRQRAKDFASEKAADKARAETKKSNVRVTNWTAS